MAGWSIGLRRARWLLVGCALLAAAAALAVWFLRPVDRLERAEAALARADWPEVEAHARAVLSEQRNHPRALRLLARANLAQDRWRQAAEHFQQSDPATLARSDLDALASSLAARGNLFLAELLRGTLAGAPAREPGATLSPGQVADARLAAEKLASLELAETRLHVVLGLIDAARPDGGAPAQLADALLKAFDQVPFAFGTPASAERVINLRARAQLGAGQYGAALATLAAAPPGPSAARLARLRSRALLGVGRTQDALAALAGSQDPSSIGEIEPDPAPYVGSAACAECHAGHAQSQGQSRHTQTFPRPHALQGLTSPMPLADPANPSVTHTLTHDGHSIQATAQVGHTRHSTRVRYAFGSGRRGVTFVAVDDQDTARELRLSHYAGQGWDRTTGHPVTPATPADYLGRRVGWSDILACLGCHTTEPRAARDQSGPAAADPGIGCERCHGPGGNHIRAVAAKFPDLAIALPSGARAAEVTRLCGQCHKPAANATANALSGAVAARFQAATLPLSRCYNPASAALTCVTCHNPHRASLPSLEAYSTHCLACHAPKPAAGAGATSPQCPVNPRQNCAGCHMPKVDGSTAPTTFTDHHIRIHRNDSTAPPVRP